jgi:hypothetical protein
MMNRNKEQTPTRRKVTMDTRGSAHNGGPGLPEIERKNFEQMLAVYESQQNIFNLP